MTNNTDLARLVTTYADLRAHYLPTGEDFHDMSVNDQHLYMEIAGMRRAARLVADPMKYETERGIPTWLLPQYEAARAEILGDVDA